MIQHMWAGRGMLSAPNSINYKHFLCIRISERLPNCITYIILDTKRNEGANGFTIMLLLLLYFRFGLIKLHTVPCST